MVECTIGFWKSKTGVLESLSVSASPGDVADSCPHPPRCRSYQFPGSQHDRRRYWLLWCLVLGSILWWLGPLLGIFVFDPFIQLQLYNSQVPVWRGDARPKGVPWGMEAAA